MLYVILDCFGILLAMLHCENEATLMGDDMKWVGMILVMCSLYLMG